MRLTGGQLRGRKVKACGMGSPSSHGALRATSSRVREAVFNIAGQSMEGLVFVDLYAGTGTMGMEAMSRGAERVFFVESDPERYSVLRETLEGCGCSARAEILNMPAVDFIRTFSDTGKIADILYLDPPYDSDELEKMLPLIAQSGVLPETGIVLAEHDRNLSLADEAGELIKRKTYKYGDTMLSLYRVRDE
jgi:16S rRNA (guanine(966)-N(2))-methyltransferase RsmD